MASNFKPWGHILFINFFLTLTGGIASIMEVIIRNATAEDCQRLSALICDASKDGPVLKKTPKQVRALLGNYFVASVSNEVVGVCGFKIWPGRQPEIVSLVVKKEYRGLGLGSRLVRRCLQEIKAKGLNTAFTLTTTPSLFEKLGFRRVEHRFFAQKIWDDCRFCPENIGDHLDPKCKEISLHLIIK